MTPSQPTAAPNWPDAQNLRTLHANARTAAEAWSLPFRGRTWRGATGSFAGAGIGSSIDFQDHRQYLPGDDPRYIDWQAYARTGHYSMKLYREEVSPRVDFILDVSASMFADEKKASRTIELLYFCVESALRSSSAIRCTTTANGGTPWPLESILGYHPPPGIGSTAALNLAAIPFRESSLRVLLSDLLFPGSPEPSLRALAAGRGRGILLAPFTPAESDPDWTGNVDLRDCETTDTRSQNVTPDLLHRYREAYARHFDLWRDQAHRHAIHLAQIKANQPLMESLAPHLEPA